MKLTTEEIKHALDLSGSRIPDLILSDEEYNAIRETRTFNNVIALLKTEVGIAEVDAMHMEFKVFQHRI